MNARNTRGWRLGGARRSRQNGSQVNRVGRGNLGSTFSAGPLLLLAISLVAPCALSLSAVAQEQPVVPDSAQDGALVRPQSAARLHARAERYVDQFSQQARLKARVAHVERDLPRLEAGSVAGLQPPGFDKLSDPEQQALGKFRLANAQGVKQAWDALLEAENAQNKILRDRLAEVVAIRFAQGANPQRSRREAIASGDLRLWRVAVCAAPLILLLVSWHQGRHWWRRKLSQPWLRRAVNLSLVVVVVGASAAFVGLDRLVATGAAQLDNQSDELTGAVRLLEQQLNELQPKYEKASQAWLEVPGLVPALASERQLWGEVLKRRAAAQEALVLRKTLADEVLAESQKVAPSAGSAAGDYGWFPIASMVVLTCCICGAAFVLFCLWRRQLRASRTCPLCLSEGTLQREPVGGAHGHSLDNLRCTYAESGPAQKCDFVFPAKYQDLPKLYFPTLGHPTSGKTLWLAMVYDELIKGNFGPQVRFSPVSSIWAEDFYKIVRGVIKSKIKPGGTQTHQIPRPLLFDFKDRDWWGRSNVLVNIFDYSGETTQRTLENAMRRRALQAHGYFYFLDPTKTSDEQAKALVDFNNDVERMCGRGFRGPVALCVSKIDLLVTQPYAGGAVDQFYERLSAIDPTGNHRSLAVLRARSELTRELRDVIWGNWNIEHLIQDLFGDRYMFFPLTPVGLNELGEEDLQERIIIPYGILEPLMWLLHMNGYPVLS